MANNPVILCSHVFRTTDETKRRQAYTEKWIEYLKLMEQTKPNTLPERTS